MLLPISFKDNEIPSIDAAIVRLGNIAIRIPILIAGLALPGGSHDGKISLRS